MGGSALPRRGEPLPYAAKTAHDLQAAGLSIQTYRLSRTIRHSFPLLT